MVTYNTPSITLFDQVVNLPLFIINEHCQKTTQLRLRKRFQLRGFPIPSFWFEVEVG